MRGDTFFVRRLDLPAGTPEAEVPGFVALQLEELSPFPLEQLYHGHLRAHDGSAVLVYAAYRRRFPAEQTLVWADAQYVMPDFAPALRLRFNSSTVVLLRSDSALTALYFEGGRELPVRVASRLVAADAPPDAFEHVRETVCALVDAGTAHQVRLRSDTVPETRSKGLQIFLSPEDHGTGSEVFLPADECWAMDVRDPAFVAEQRKRLGFDLVLWRIVLGAAAALAVLLLGEGLLFAGKGYTSWLRHRIEQRAAEVASIKDRDAAATRLEDFGRNGVQPFDMLRAVGSVKPASVWLNRSTAKGATVLEIDGSAGDLASINAYETAIRAVPSVKNVEVRRANASSGGSTFSFAITFNAGSFNRDAAVAQSNP